MRYIPKVKVKTGFLGSIRWHCHETSLHANTRVQSETCLTALIPAFKKSQRCQRRDALSGWAVNSQKKEKGGRQKDLIYFFKQQTLFPPLSGFSVPFTTVVAFP